MKKFLSLAACCLMLGACSEKTPGYSPAPVAAKETLRLTLLPERALEAGKPVTVLAKLTHLENGRLLTGADLDTAHTEKLHLLLVDPTLTDYRHLHPQPTATPGVFSFTFTPRRAVGWRAWADVTPRATGLREFAKADLGKVRTATIDKTETRSATVDGYRFTLAFDRPPVLGEEAMGTVAVTDAKGRPVTLEPVMGAKAHIVGFYDTLHGVLHTHAMEGGHGAHHAPHGGGEIMFHLAPARAGFIKLFVQVKIGGREIYAPFGVRVASPS